MPSLCGIISPDPAKRRPEFVEAMVASMRHETFHATGTCYDADVGLSVGWGVLDGAYSDGTPARSTAGGCRLIFSGEHYGDDERHGVGCLLPRCEKDVVAFLRQLNGWFAGVLMDSRGGPRATLFNDPLGLHGLLYVEDGETVYFASEGKALLRILPELREIDPQSMADYVSCGTVLEDRTFFRRVRRIPAGSAWTVEAGRVVDRTRYFTPDAWEGAEALDEPEFFRQLRTTFKSLLPRYFRSTERVAMSLTGGLDTRIVMASVDLPEGEVPCYTFGSMYRDCYDVRVARRVAAVCRQPHHVIEVGESFLREFDTYARRTVLISEGAVDVMGATELYANAQARSIAPVRMTGNCGSEVLRGSSFLGATRSDASAFTPEIDMLCRNSEQILTAARRLHPLTFSLWEEIPRYGRRNLVQSQLTLRTPYLDKDLLALLYRAPAGARAGKTLSQQLVRSGNPMLADIVTDRGLGGRHPLVSRFLLRPYLEMLFRLEHRYNYGMHDAWARLDYRMRRCHPERLFLGHHKFYHFRLWFRDQLAEHVQSVLLDPRALGRSHVHAARVETIVREHVGGQANHTTELAKLLTLELLQGLLVDDTSPAGNDRHAV